MATRTRAIEKRTAYGADFLFSCLRTSHCADFGWLGWDGSRRGVQGWCPGAQDEITDYDAYARFSSLIHPASRACSSGQEWWQSGAALSKQPSASTSPSFPDRCGDRNDGQRTGFTISAPALYASGAYSRAVLSDGPVPVSAGRGWQRATTCCAAGARAARCRGGPPSSR